MPEHESLPDPMPDDPGKRQEVEELLHTMDVRQAAEGEKAEVDRIRSEVLEGRPVDDIVGELGGVDEAKRVIGGQHFQELMEIKRDQEAGNWPLNKQGDN